MLASECVCFNPFWVESVASKLSETPCIRPFSQLNCVVSFPEEDAADILNLRISSYDAVIPYP